MSLLRACRFSHAPGGRETLPERVRTSGTCTAGAGGGQAPGVGEGKTFPSSESASDTGEGVLGAGCSGMGSGALLVLVEVLGCKRFWLWWREGKAGCSFVIVTFYWCRSNGRRSRRYWEFCVEIGLTYLSHSLFWRNPYAKNVGAVCVSIK